jgi:hypothetical protein
MASTIPPGSSGAFALPAGPVAQAETEPCASAVQLLPLHELDALPLTFTLRSAFSASTQFCKLSPVST